MIRQIMSDSQSTLIKKDPNSGRKNLVFIRGGNTSMHYDLYPLPDNRNWDLCLSAYEEPRTSDLEKADIVLRGGVSKWTTFYELFFLGEQILSKYESIMVMDDDVVFERKTDIDLCFKIASERELLICQPSLDHQSHHSFKITLNHPPMLIRYINFVECMVPILSSCAIHKLKDCIKSNVSGWGLDLIWRHVLGQPSQGLAVLYVIKVLHNRAVNPHGGAFYNFLKSVGIDPQQEKLEMLDRFNIKEFYIQNLGGIPRREGGKWHRM